MTVFFAAQRGPEVLLFVFFLDFLDFFSEQLHM